VAGRYREVVGIDPDPGMIEEARRLATERTASNATFVQVSGEDLPYGLGDFDAVTFASSFHWMDREQVATTVRRMLTAGGAVVQVDTVRDGDERTGWYPPPPRTEIRTLVRRYLGAERRAGQTVGFVSPSNEDEVWRAAGYAGPQRVRVPDGRILDRSVDDVIAGTLSMSYAAPHLFGDRLADFRDDVRAMLAAVSPRGYFSVQLPDTELKIWRPADRSSAAACACSTWVVGRR
jgi:SAM-dependent methyltransferase